MAAPQDDAATPLGFHQATTTITITITDNPGICHSGAVTASVKLATIWWPSSTTSRSISAGSSSEINRSPYSEQLRFGPEYLSTGLILLTTS